MPGLRRLQSRLTVMVRGFARRRPNWIVAFAIEEANLSEGMRAAGASTAMLLLGMCVGRPEFAWAAIGALDGRYTRTYCSHLPIPKGFSPA